MHTENDIHTDSTAPQSVGAVPRVEQLNWYVAVVNCHSEKASAQKLTAMGHECFVAAQDEYRIWRNGKRAKVTRVVIPSVLFVRCTEKQRREIVTLPFIFRFLTNRAATSSGLGSAIAVIPPAQIDRLRFMLGNSDTPVEFEPQSFGKGDRVRVIRGKLAGLEGEALTSTDGTSNLFVGIAMLGFAKVCISPADLERIDG